MTSATVTLVIAAFLSGAVIAVFVMLVAGIHAGDRPGRLTAAPRSHLEALTRACSASASAPVPPPATETAKRTDDAHYRPCSRPADIRCRKCRGRHRQCRHGISRHPQQFVPPATERNGHAMTATACRTTPSGLAMTPEAIP